MNKVTVNNTDSFFLDDEALDVQLIEDGVYHFIKDAVSYTAHIHSWNEEEKMLDLSINNVRYQLKIEDQMDLLLERLGISAASQTKANDIKAPMPGRVVSVPVSAGAKIEKGTPLIILEAMKMENVIKSTGAGTIHSIEVKENQAVEKGQILIRFE